MLRGLRQEGLRKIKREFILNFSSTVYNLKTQNANLIFFLIIVFRMITNTRNLFPKAAWERNGKTLIGNWSVYFH
jgi:hypothetical protein